jgi:hypothetical protein
LVITAPDGLRNGSSRLPPSVPARTRGDQLRIVGRIVRDDVIVTEPVRLEPSRLAGAGAPFITAFVAVGLDAQGHPLTTERIRTSSATRIGAFVVMLPVSDEVVSVELRFQPETLAVELRAQPETVLADLATFAAPVRTAPIPGLAGEAAPLVRFVGAPRKPLPMLARPSGRPHVGILSVDAERVRWQVGHGQGVRSAIELEVGRRRQDGVTLWTRLDSPGLNADGSEALLGLDRPLASGGIEQIRVVASDGWNTSEAVRPLAVQPLGLRIRVIDARRYWLELREPRTTPIEWSVWDRETFEKHSTVLLRRASGSAAPSSAPQPLRLAKLTLGEVFHTEVEESGRVLLAVWENLADHLTLPAAAR